MQNSTNSNYLLSEECAICLEPLVPIATVDNKDENPYILEIDEPDAVNTQTPKKVTTLKSCGHHFHKECIDSWSRTICNNNLIREVDVSCPLCKAISKNKLESPANIDYLAANAGSSSVNETLETNLEHSRSNIIDIMTIITFNNIRFKLMAFTFIDSFFGSLHLFVYGNIFELFGILVSLSGYIGAKFLKTIYLTFYLWMCIMKTVFLMGMFINRVSLNKMLYTIDIIYILFLILHVYLIQLTTYLIYKIIKYRHNINQLINTSIIFRNTINQADQNEN